MAKKRKRRRSSTRGATGWPWMLFGLGIGLAIAAAVYYSGHRAPVPRAAIVDDERARPAAASPPAGPSRTRDDSTPSEPHPAARFDFYDMLPQVEVVIPDTPRGTDRAERANEVEAAGNYVLQAGAFTRVDDADRMQANLALLGIESRIQSVPIDDDIYHRVRIGPIDDLAELNQVRRRLWEADVDTMLLRVPN